MLAIILLQTLEKEGEIERDALTEDLIVLFIKIQDSLRVFSGGFINFKIFSFKINFWNQIKLN